eukprot:scaffold33180_cov20-Tisochrysis_lutea.AAC.1
MADQWCQLTSAWLYSAYLLSRLSTRVGKADIKGACSALQARVSRIKCLQMDIFAGARAHVLEGARVRRQGETHLPSKGHTHTQTRRLGTENAGLPRVAQDSDPQGSGLRTDSELREGWLPRFLALPSL